MDSLAVPTRVYQRLNRRQFRTRFFVPGWGKITCDLKSFFSKTKKRKWEMGLSALDRSLHISHGRKPVDGIVSSPSPVGAQDSSNSFESFAPLGLGSRVTVHPGLAPGATLCRRSAAEYGRGFQRKLARRRIHSTLLNSELCSRLQDF